MKDAANKEEEQSEEEEEEQEEEGIRQVNLEGNEFNITKDTNK